MEKLLSYVRNSTVAVNNSNNWNFKIDVEAIKERENDAFKDVYAQVLKKEDLIKTTEKMMQLQSMYDERYKPQFINEMTEEEIKEFSKVISQKQRYVKLAISKANLGQNKYNNFENKKEDKLPPIEKKKKKVVKAKEMKSKIKLCWERDELDCREMEPLEFLSKASQRGMLNRLWCDE